MDPTVFISYDSTADSAFASRLATELRSAGRTVWMAPDSIRVGESFPSAIGRGLEAAAVFLLVVTPAAMGSRWVRTEIDAAIEMERRSGRPRFVVVVLRKTPLPPLLANYQAVAFTDEFEPSMRQLLAVLSSEDALGPPPEQRRQDGIATALPDAGTSNDPYTRRVLEALHAGASHGDYLVQPTSSGGSGIVSAIAEREMLRVGVAAFGDAEEEERAVLSNLQNELALNPHRVACVLGIQRSDHVAMEMYASDAADSGSALRAWREDEDTPDGEPPRIIHLRWTGATDQAIAQALDLVFHVLRGREWSGQPVMDSYVQAAISALKRSAGSLNIGIEDVKKRRNSIVWALLDPEGARIGVAVWPRGDVDQGDALEDLSRELHANPHGVARLLGIYDGRTTSLQRFDLLESGGPDAFVLVWNPKGGADSMRGAVEQVLEASQWGEGPDPVAAAFHHGRADALIEAGMLEEAALEADEAIRLDPAYTEAHAARAHALVLLGRPDSALAAAKRGLMLDSSSLTLHAALADSLLALGHPAEAVGAADRALELDPRFAVGHSIRAEALLELGRPADALGAADQAVSLGLRDPAIHTTRAEALLEVGDAKGALTAADAALALEPDEPAARSVRAKAASMLRSERASGR